MSPYITSSLLPQPLLCLIASDDPKVLLQALIYIYNPNPNVTPPTL